MSLETLIFTCQRETFTRFSLPLYLDRGNSFQDNGIKRSVMRNLVI